MGPVRNYKLWKIVNNDNGSESHILKGFSDIKNYIIDNQLNIKLSMLIKWKKHKNYSLIEVER